MLHEFVGPRKGLVISAAEDFSSYIVRDGIVVDKDYMNLLPKEKKEAVPANKDQLVLYLSLLRVPKDPTTVITRDTSTNSIQTHRNNKDVIFSLLVVLYRTSLYKCTLYSLR